MFVSLPISSSLISVIIIVIIVIISIIIVTINIIILGKRRNKNHAIGLTLSMASSAIGHADYVVCDWRLQKIIIYHSSCRA